jgi:probable rRNA maturation factor
VNGILRVENRTRHHLNLPLLKRVGRFIPEEILGREDYDLCVWLVNDAEMIRTNEGRLRHKGTTDVISFDYGGQEPNATLAGELFICLDEALRQAARYRVSSGLEIARYLLHGLLHLAGYDDQMPQDRRRMKSAENRFLKDVARHFNLEELQKPQQPSPARHKYAS